MKDSSEFRLLAGEFNGVTKGVSVGVLVITDSLLEFRSRLSGISENSFPVLKAWLPL